MKLPTRNNLTREAFEKALEKENRKLTEYKNQVKIDILKSAIVGSVIRTSAAVSDQEVEEYIKKNQSGATAPLEGKKVKLSQIVLSNEKHSEEEARTILTQIREDADDADSFAELLENIPIVPTLKMVALLERLRKRILILSSRRNCIT